MATRDADTKPELLSTSRAGRGLPVYQQLYVVLRDQMIDGQIRPDEPLASEHALCAKFSVSRNSVRRALQMLEQDGLIERRRGSGTYPTRACLDAHEAPQLDGMLDNLVTSGVATKAKTLSFGYELPPPAASSALVSAQRRCLRIERLRLHKQLAFSLTNIWVPPPIDHVLAEEEIGDELIVRLIEKGGYEPVAADQSLTAVPAVEDAARALNVAIGTPLIRLRRTVLDGQDRPLLFQQSVYLPERFEYRMRLSREIGGRQPTWSYVG